MTFGEPVLGWPEIACQRGHDGHDSRLVEVDLARTSFDDYAPVPPGLVRSFAMHVWKGHAEGGAYCPACCAVSEMIRECGVHEQRETVLALSVMDGHDGEAMVDFGAHIGWYTMLALSCGLYAWAVDADPENLRLLSWSAEVNGWSERLTWISGRFGRDMAATVSGNCPVRFAKLDVEGAEDVALRSLWPNVSAGLVDHLLIEVSPCFADYYPSLVRDLIDAGYAAYCLPDKARPPITLDDPAFDMQPYLIDTGPGLEAWVASIRQQDLWFRREGASW